MGRAIVRQPAAFLMDEPLSNLDAKLRVQMRAEIHRLQRELGVTTIYVTHDQVEAMTMGDRVAVMRKGELQQVATPQELYDHPVNLFVAGFIGSPAMNLLEADGRARRRRPGARARLAAAARSAPARRARWRTTPGGASSSGIRPEGLEDAALDEHRDTQQSLTAQVELREALGSEIVLHLRIDAAPAQTDETRELARDVGNERAAGGPEPARTRRSWRASTAVRRPRRADDVELSVDPDSLHFFDAETSLGIYDS